MIQQLFNKMGTDGMMHCIVSAAATALLGLVLPWWCAAAIVTAIGAAKEIVWDKALKKGSPEWKDFACDIAGVIIGAM